MFDIHPKDLYERLSHVKIKLLTEHPFFGHFLLNTELIEEITIPTAATNGINIYYNKSFFDQLNDSQLKAVLIHEILHIIYSHCNRKRRGTRDIKKYNIAADYAINWEITEMGDYSDIKLPHDILINNNLFKVYVDKKYRNMYIEQIYDLLPDSKLDNNFDVHIDMVLDEDATNEIKDRILSAYNMLDDIGKIPVGIKRLVNEIKPSKVLWSKVFYRYIGNILIREDYSYVQPNRRFIGQELYLPSLLSHKLGKIGFFVDCSGSISDADINTFTSELRKVATLVSEIVVSSWDTKIHTWETIHNMNNLEKAIKFRGGGGTDVGCVFNEIKKRREHFDLVIVLTDGEYGKLPPKNSIKYPIIFVMTKNIKPEWGVSIYMNRDNRI